MKIGQPKSWAHCFSSFLRIQLAACFLVLPLILHLIQYSVAYAQEDSSPSSSDATVPPETNEESPFLPAYEVPDRPQISGFSLRNLIRWVFALILSVAMIYIVAFLLKKGLTPYQRPPGNQESFNILGHLYLGPKRALYLIAVADRVLVIAVTDTAINTLAEITDVAVVASLKNEALMYESPNSRFIQYLKRATSKKVP